MYRFEKKENLHCVFRRWLYSIGFYDYNICFRNSNDFCAGLIFYPILFNLVFNVALLLCVRRLAFEPLSLHKVLTGQSKCSFRWLCFAVLYPVQCTVLWLKQEGR